MPNNREPPRMSELAPTVLVVDDEVQIRRFLRAGLELDGFVVQDAETGADALKSVTLKQPDLVILDLGLPDMDGGEVLARADASPYGLQAGLFTNDLRLVERAFERLTVGALIVNDINTFRVDQMPYGGAKRSGWGREGMRYAIEEMTEERLLVVDPR